MAMSDSAYTLSFLRLPLLVTLMSPSEPFTLRVFNSALLVRSSEEPSPLTPSVLSWPLLVSLMSELLPLTLMVFTAPLLVTLMLAFSLLTLTVPTSAFLAILRVSLSSEISMLLPEAFSLRVLALFTLSFLTEALLVTVPKGTFSVMVRLGKMFGLITNHNNNGF